MCTDIRRYKGAVLSAIFLRCLLTVGVLGYPCVSLALAPSSLVQTHRLAEIFERIEELGKTTSSEKAYQRLSPVARSLRGEQRVLALQLLFLLVRSSSVMEASQSKELISRLKEDLAHDIRVSFVPQGVPLHHATAYDINVTLDGETVLDEVWTPAHIVVRSTIIESVTIYLKPKFQRMGFGTEIRRRTKQSFPERKLWSTGVDKGDRVASDFAVASLQQGVVDAIHFDADSASWLALRNAKVHSDSQPSTHALVLRSRQEFKALREAAPTERLDVTLSDIFELIRRFPNAAIENIPGLEDHYNRLHDVLLAQSPLERVRLFRVLRAATDFAQAQDLHREALTQRLQQSLGQDLTVRLTPPTIPHLHADTFDLEVRLKGHDILRPDMLVPGTVAHVPGRYVLLEALFFITEFRNVGLIRLVLRHIANHFPREPIYAVVVGPLNRRRTALWQRMQDEGLIAGILDLGTIDNYSDYLGPTEASL